VPPFNLIVLPFLPFFVLVRHKKRLRCLNNFLTTVIFLPFALLAAVTFAFGNFLLAPVAYIFGIYYKVKLAQRSKISCKNFVFFLALGLPMMYLTQIADFFYFLKHIYAFRTDYLQSKKIDGISIEAFNTLEAVVKREMRHPSDNFQDPMLYKAKKLIKIMRYELEISKCIQSLIFGRFSSMK